MPNPARSTEPAAEDTAKAKATGSSGVVLAVVYPHDVFDPSLEGIDPITADGTEVPESRVDEIKKLARDNGVRLQKVSN